MLLVIFVHHLIMPAKLKRVFLLFFSIAVLTQFLLRVCQLIRQMQIPSSLDMQVFQKILTHADHCSTYLVCNF